VAEGIIDGGEAEVTISTRLVLGERDPDRLQHFVRRKAHVIPRLAEDATEPNLRVAARPTRKRRGRGWCWGAWCRPGWSWAVSWRREMPACRRPRSSQARSTHSGRLGRQAHHSSTFASW